MAAGTASATRVRKLNIKQKKKVIQTTGKLKGSFRLFGSACRHLWRNRKLFGGILLVYAVLYFLLVKGLAANFNLSETRQSIDEAVGGDLGNFELASSLFGALVGGAGSASSEASGVYQTVLFVVISLVLIWALRQTFDGKAKPSIRKSFYNGPSQLVPYVLVLLVIVLQLLPALLGISIYGIVISNGIAVGAFEQILWLIILFGLLAVSVYLTSSSLFASYIVTLPGMTPMKALRSARKLVRFRRFSLIRKILFLPVIIGLVMALIFLPLVLLATAFAEVLFLVFMLVLLLIGHAYFYLLYRELL